MSGNKTLITVTLNLRKRSLCSLILSTGWPATCVSIARMAGPSCGGCNSMLWNSKISFKSTYSIFILVHFSITRTRFRHSESDFNSGFSASQGFGIQTGHPVLLGCRTHCDVLIMLPSVYNQAKIEAIIIIVLFHMVKGSVAVQLINVNDYLSVTGIGEFCKLALTWSHTVTAIVEWTCRMWRHLNAGLRDSCIRLWNLFTH